MGEAHRTVVTYEPSNRVLTSATHTFVFFALQYWQAADTCALFAGGPGGSGGRARPLFGAAA